MTLQLRTASVDDLEPLLQLEQSCFDSDQLGRASLRYLLQSPTAHVRLIEQLTHEQFTVVGYSIGLTRANSKIWRIYSLAVAAQARGQGIAARLIEDSLIRAKQLGCQTVSLEVMTTNTAALALYRRFGFEVTDLLAQYYQNGEDGYRMRLTLREPD